MKPSDKLNQALNQQVGHEFAASQQYVAIAAYFDGEALPGLAGFFYRQAEEEREHAMKLVKYLVDSGGELEIPAVPAPRHGLGSAVEAVQLAVESEQRVTGQIYSLVELARQDGDLIAERFLDWFVHEQFEEMTTMGGLLQVVERAGEGQLLRVEEYLERQPHPEAEGEEG